MFLRCFLAASSSCSPLPIQQDGERKPKTSFQHAQPSDLRPPGPQPLRKHDSAPPHLLCLPVKPLARLSFRLWLPPRVQRPALYQLSGPLSVHPNEPIHFLFAPWRRLLSPSGSRSGRRDAPAHPQHPARPWAWRLHYRRPNAAGQEYGARQARPLR